MPSVRIEDDAFGDLRYDTLAQVAGLADADHARGKMARLWRQCTAERIYILTEAEVCAVLGPRGVNAIIAARLGDQVSRGIRIRGTKGRIEWLANLRENGKKGGRPRKASNETRQKPSGSGESNPPSPSPSPSPVSAPAPVQGSEIAPAAPSSEPDKPAQAKRRAEAKPTPPGYAATIATFHAAYEAQTGSKPTWGAKQGAMVKQLLEAHGSDEVQARIGRLFAGAIAAWCHAPYDLGTLVQHFDKLADVTAPPVAAPRTSQQTLRGLAAVLAVDTSELQ